MKTAIGLLVWLTIWVGGLLGYIFNIVQITHMIGAPTVTPLFIAKIVGVVVFPLGVVLGWLG